MRQMSTTLRIGMLAAMPRPSVSESQIQLALTTFHLYRVRTWYKPWFSRSR